MANGGTGRVLTGCDRGADAFLRRLVVEGARRAGPRADVLVGQAPGKRTATRRQREGGADMARSARLRRSRSRMPQLGSAATRGCSREVAAPVARPSAAGSSSSTAKSPPKSRSLPSIPLR